MNREESNSTFAPCLELSELVAGRRCLVSIDTDFFCNPAEQGLVSRFDTWLRDVLSAGVPVVVEQDHVRLVDLIRERVDVIVNFDFHMDLRIDFLNGDAARRPPHDATVFESILADGLVDTYIWAHPVSRRRDAAQVFATAYLTGRQPVLGKIHCVDGADVLDHILDRVHTTSAFVCRSPGYATRDTDLVFSQLQATAATFAPPTSR